MDSRYGNTYSSTGTDSYSSSGSGNTYSSTGSNGYGSSIGGVTPTTGTQYVDVSTTYPVPPPTSFVDYNSQTQTPSNMWGGYNARVRQQHANQQIIDSKYDSCSGSCTIV